MNPVAINLPRLTLQILLSLSIAMYAAMAFAAKDEIYTSFLSDAGAGGYDVVAYFTESRPVEGSKDFVTEYKGAEWRFASQENLDMFLGNPDKYVPQYGGYCAWAVANNATASGDPLQWSVVNDKLYLNYDANIQVQWEADRDKFIVLGDKNWPDVLN